MARLGLHCILHGCQREVHFVNENRSANGCDQRVARVVPDSFYSVPSDLTHWLFELFANTYLVVLEAPDQKTVVHAGCGQKFVIW